MSKLTQFAATITLAAALAAPAFAAQEPMCWIAQLPRFSYNHFGYSTQVSRFNKTTGKSSTTKKEAKTASVDIVIDATSVDSGFPVFNEHLRGEDFFDTAKYPTAAPSNQTKSSSKATSRAPLKAT